MFSGCFELNCDLSNWNVQRNVQKANMFYDTKYFNKKPKWYSNI